VVFRRPCTPLEDRLIDSAELNLSTGKFYGGISKGTGAQMMWSPSLDYQMFLSSGFSDLNGSAKVSTFSLRRMS
jgi:hypothetical protein